MCSTEQSGLNGTGIGYEPDQRHAELIVQALGLESSKAVSTPGCAETKEELMARKKTKLLDNSSATRFRSVAARLNYLSLDRPDLQYTARNVAKCMSAPREGDWCILKRVGRYLKGASRLVQEFEWQEMPRIVSAYSDSDWAGDKETRQSTSGGLLMMGSHLIKSWSSTQKVIALSSGEAELYAMIKGATQATGLMSMLGDWGIDAQAVVNTDATAAMGIAHRSGLGKTRHIEVQYLWIQKEVKEEKIGLKKVRTDLNPADLMTKDLKAETVEFHLKAMGLQRSNKRAESALECNQSCAPLGAHGDGYAPLGVSKYAPLGVGNGMCGARFSTRYRPIGAFCAQAVY